MGIMVLCICHGLVRLSFFLHYAPIQNSHFQKDQKVTVAEHLATASTSKTSKAAPFSDDFLPFGSGCSVDAQWSRNHPRAPSRGPTPRSPGCPKRFKPEVQLAGFALNFEDL